MTPPITYTPKYISDPDACLEALQKELAWERRADAPRSEYYCNDYLKPYTYGRGRGVRTYEPQVYHPVIMSIRRQIEDLTGAVFEVCFLNRYLNQSDQLGYHADDSPEMDDARPIAIVSFGAERDIMFRPKGSSDIEPTRLTLGHGSLCLMSPGMQDYWEHRIPKASRMCGERISLTFRGYVLPTTV